MIITSKNGLKLEIKAAHWWNILDWITIFAQAHIIKNQNIFINDAEVWKFTYGSVAKV